jgi:hypothetical protein
LAAGLSQHAILYFLREAHGFGKEASGIDPAMREASIVRFAIITIENRRAGETAEQAMLTEVF